MMAPHAGLERRVLAALEATPARIPVVIGGCGTGRTTLLHALGDRMGFLAQPVPQHGPAFRVLRRRHAQGRAVVEGGMQTMNAHVSC